MTRCLWMLVSGCLLAGPAAAAAATRDLVPAFLADCAAKAAAAEKAGAISVAGRDDWLFLGAELRHLGAGRFWGDDAAKASRAENPQYADPLPAIVDFKQQLDRLGIELLLVPVPAKAVVYPDMLSDRITVAQGAPVPRVDAADREFHDVLRAAGVNVLDLTPDFLAGRFGIEGPLFCRRDSHWSGSGCVVAARRIAAVIKDRPWLKDRQKAALDCQWRAVEAAGDLSPAGARPNEPPEKIPLRFVGRRAAGGGLEPMPEDRTSPVLLLGDSNNLVFHAGGDLYTVGAGLPDQLALELGLAVDVAAVRGSGATAARLNLVRRAQTDPDYLKAKRLVIWCFAAREFTETDGWRALPLSRPAPAAK
jgi:alginate O-acetyltransferase complex protein AlgJ